MRGLWRLLAAHRDYRLLATAHLVSALGDYLLGVGLVYLVYDLTGSTLASAGMLVVSVLPQALLASPAGVLVDRWDRRRTLATCSVLQVAILAPLLFVTDDSRIWLLYVVAGAQALVEQLSFPAEQALVPHLVPGRRPGQRERRQRPGRQHRPAGRRQPRWRHGRLGRATGARRRRRGHLRGCGRAGLRHPPAERARTRRPRRRAGAARALVDPVAGRPAGGDEQPDPQGAAGLRGRYGGRRGRHGHAVRAVRPRRAARRGAGLRLRLGHPGGRRRARWARCRGVRGPDRAGAAARDGVGGLRCDRPGDLPVPAGLRVRLAGPRPDGRRRRAGRGRGRELHDAAPARDDRRLPGPRVRHAARAAVGRRAGRARCWPAGWVVSGAAARSSP